MSAQDIFDYDELCKQLDQETYTDHLDHPDFPVVVADELAKAA